MNAANKKVFLQPEQLRAAMILDEELLHNQIRQAQKRDSYTKESIKEMRDESPSQFHITADGLLAHREKIYIPRSNKLRTEILQAHHDHPLRGHPGVTKTCHLLRRKYYWPGMRRDVKQYIRACATCQRVKIVRAKPKGFMKTLPVAERKW